MQDAAVAADSDASSLMFQRIHAVARLLGLAISIDGSRLSLALDTSAASRCPPWSSGEIIQPEPLLLGRPAPGGLACPAIFGAWHAPDPRRFGHIALPCFMVPLPARLLLAPLLDETESDLLTLNALEPESLLARIEAAHAAGQTVLGRSPLEFVWWSIPVISPVLQAVDPHATLFMDGPTAISPTLHAVYWRVANRTRRLRRLMALDAPMTIIENERRLVACAIDELIVNVDLEEPRVDMVEGIVPTPAFDALTLFFAALGSKLVEIGERHAAAEPEGKSWIAKAARIGRGEVGGEPRLVSLWRLAAEQLAEPLDDEMRKELMLSGLPR